MITNAWMKKDVFLNPLFLFILILISCFIPLKKAQSQTACSILRSSNGTLIQKDDYNLITDSLGSFTVTCDASFNMRIDSIQSQNKNAIDQASVIISNGSVAIVEADTIQLVPPQTSILLEAIVNQTYFVNLTLTNISSVIPAGTYSYQIGISLVSP